MRLRSCNNFILTRCRFYANYTAGNVVYAPTHTCDSVQQRFLVFLRPENVEHGRPEVFVHLGGGPLAVDLWGTNSS